MANERTREQKSTELIVALDVDTMDEALRIVRAVRGKARWFKVASPLFTRYGPEAVRQIKEEGGKVFLDLKFQDTPEVVAQAVRAAADIGAEFTDVHTLGGGELLRSAADAACESGIRIVGVSISTSLADEDLAAMGIDSSPADAILRLTRLAQSNGITGMVCAPAEVALLRAEFGPDLVLVVPGIRPAGTAQQDQKRVGTPGDAAASGADYIVVGRPIRQAPDPGVAADAILAEIEEAGRCR